jgi:UDP-4-amino-4,6-dideoxy-N-acetyl-beta-L-altrosamine transaminase
VIPYGRQSIDQSDIDAVVKVLESDFLTQGEQTPIFEEEVAKYCNAEYGVAVNSATSALHIACLALDLKKDDWLWTSPNSFVASANCGVYCNAKIDFVDINLKTYNMSAEILEKKLIQAKIEKKLPKIVIPVHFAGQSCNMSKIYQLSRKYGFNIIEDASHAIGAKYLGRPVGGCQYSDITVFSFHPVKIITTAEGGVATTNDKKLLGRMQLFRSHGVTRDPGLMTKKSEGEWYYQQVCLGFNYRMTELQSALGISQIKKLDKFVAERHLLRDRYDRLLENLSLIRPYQHPDSYSSLHLYPIQLQVNNIKKRRVEIFNTLRGLGIGVNVHYIPIYSQPYYSKFNFKKEDFPNNEEYYKCTISLPIFQGLSFEKQKFIANSVRACVCMN